MKKIERRGSSPNSRKNLNSAKKGEIRNPNGRPAKIYTVIKKKGFSKDDIRTVFFEMSYYNIVELNKITDDQTIPVICKVVASCYIEAIKTGDYSKVKELIAQIIGKPKEDIDINIDSINIIKPEIKND